MVEGQKYTLGRMLLGATGVISDSMLREGTASPREFAMVNGRMVIVGQSETLRELERNALRCKVFRKEIN